MNPEYSIVVPFYNEEEVLPSFMAELSKAMDNLGEEYEILAIDDGSEDKTSEILRDMVKSYSKLSYFQLTRNFGHQAAVLAGLNLAEGKYVGIIDGDGQDPPQVLASMFKILREGHDVVYGLRKNRKEGLWFRVFYKLFYKILFRISKASIPLDSGDFSVMDRKVVDFILRFSNPTPFIRGLRAWYGGNQKPFMYDRQIRQGGVSKYSISDLVQLALVGFVTSSKVPIRLAIYIGMFVSFVTFLYSSTIIFLKLFTTLIDGSELIGWSSLIALTGLIGGMILMILGIFGEYLLHIFETTRNQPAYVIKEQNPTL